ncbi:MAG: NAD(P)-binding domain-containing protein, partial [Candidatus Wallbacteria bacterium]|nr:NAD(P)-binding domain-containing protein [Candidatus Wallbacteria bacterium]
MGQISLAKGKAVKPVRVMQWGLGAMGSGMARLMLQKESIKLVAAYEKRPEGQGQDLAKTLELKKATGIIVGSDPMKEIKKHKPDVVIMATCSTVKESYEEIIPVIEQGINVITIAEEMAYPWANEPKLSDKIHKAAVKNGVVVLGTGINPGFVLDA